MIRNTVIHLANEQPLVADLFSLPTSADVSLVCTNLRMLNGKRPVFADRTESVFVFPYAHIRFLEIAPEAVAAAGATASGEDDASNGSGRNRDGSAGPASTPAGHGTGATGGSLDDPRPADGRDAPAAAEPALAGGGVDEAAEDDLDQDLEIDEEFLRRIREV